jgi:hypothetical protein
MAGTDRRAPDSRFSNIDPPAGAGTSRLKRKSLVYIAPFFGKESS